MANSKQAKKRAIQNVKRNARNISMRSAVRTAIKKVRKAIDANDATAAQEAQKQAFPYIDKMVNKKILHGNTAARYKRNLNAAVKALVTSA